MRLITFKRGGEAHIGVARDGEVIDLSVAAPKLPRDMVGLLASGKAGLAAAAKAVKAAKAKAVVKGKINYLPPIPNPPKIICVGLNYRDHAAEATMKIPEYPILFLRVATTLVGHGQPLICPKASSHFDYEAEMVAVIGRKGRNISKEKALGYVAGYSVFNEGSIRDWQIRRDIQGWQWTLGKNFDGTGGFGPAIVTADELPPGGNGLKIQCRLNGQVLQSASTSDMIFDVARLVAAASEAITLEPGDIIVTGTPSGVGFVRNPPIFMKPGDTCEIEVENVGLLVNPIKAEK
jgi:2-keto-4-pentenoate hydratase/2-oxohepta-3-ene-1,7-dioic acid hydratase in catechol pathway